MTKKKYWFGFAVSILFVYLFFRNVDFRELWIAFQSVNYIYTIPIMLINLLSLWIRAVRWRYLLSPIKTRRTPGIVQGHGDRVYGQQYPPGPHRGIGAGLYFGGSGKNQQNRLPGDTGGREAI